VASYLLYETKRSWQAGTLHLFMLFKFSGAHSSHATAHSSQLSRRPALGHFPLKTLIGGVSKVAKKRKMRKKKKKERKIRLDTFNLH
jgi:hypothetical protein